MHQQSAYSRDHALSFLSFGGGLDISALSSQTKSRAKRWQMSRDTLRQKSQRRGFVAASECSKSEKPQPKSRRRENALQHGENAEQIGPRIHSNREKHTSESRPNPLTLLSINNHSATS